VRLGPLPPEKRLDALSDGIDKRKQSIYLPAEMLHEMKAEALRLDRSLSWIVQASWKAGKGRVQEIPAVPT
jgi:uncharacterized small protein (TIGR04563 family)